MSVVAATPVLCVRAGGLRAPARTKSAPRAAHLKRSTKAHACVTLGSRRERSLVARAADGEETEAPVAEEGTKETPPAAPASPDAAAIATATVEIKQYLKLLYVKREMNFNEVRLTLAIEDPRLADRRERYGIENESGVSADEKVVQLEMIAAIATATVEIKQYLKLLYVKREMNFNEVRLTLAIEDPRLADRRERYGIENESGVSADEKVVQLEMIDNGEMPTDLLALEMLLEDFREWPGLEEDAASAARKAAGPSRYAEIANSAAGIRGQIPGQHRGNVEDPSEDPEMDGNPFGFLVLYGVSAVPIFITIAALSIMFVNSLQ